MFFDQESAEICRKNLGDRYYRGRALTIEIKKNFHQQQQAEGMGQPQPDDDLVKQIYALRREEVKVLLGLLKNVKQDGPFFEKFLQTKPKLT